MPCLKSPTYLDFDNKIRVAIQLHSNVVVQIVTFLYNSILIYILLFPCISLEITTQLKCLHTNKSILLRPIHTHLHYIITNERMNMLWKEQSKIFETKQDISANQLNIHLCHFSVKDIFHGNNLVNNRLWKGIMKNKDSKGVIRSRKSKKIDNTLIIHNIVI